MVSKEGKKKRTMDSARKKKTGNLLSGTKGRYGWFPIPTPNIQKRCCRSKATKNISIIQTLTWEKKCTCSAKNSDDGHVLRKTT